MKMVEAFLAKRHTSGRIAELAVVSWYMRALFCCMYKTVMYRAVKTRKDSRLQYWVCRFVVSLTRS
jgi:hypothetical protein